MKKILLILLCICLISGLFPVTALAITDWPSNVAIEAEGGIVIDAETGAVLYGKNIHINYFPASITKILTALIVIENCDLDEIVTFSKNAVYNVEQGSSNMAAETGDQLTVRDCLYGLLLQSANEAGNALAEHVSGSMEAFCVLMNEKARQLGCIDSNFANPSGLNNPDHYTTAYDMALIAKAAFENETFIEIDSTRYYDIPTTKRNPDGLRIYAHHKMLMKSQSIYYPGMIGGKTGYTSLAGNTLVSCAERDGMKLITVILNGHQTHYKDTKAMLDFGFQNFESVSASKYDMTYLPIKNDMTIAGLATTDLSSLELDDTSKITIPKSADLANVTSELIYDITAINAPPKAIAWVQYSYGEQKIGSAYLLLNELDPSIIPTTEFNIPLETEESISETTTMNETESIPESLEVIAARPKIKSGPKFTFTWLTVVLIVILLVITLIIVLVLLKLRQNRKEQEDLILRRQRRLERLANSDISSSEFEKLLVKKRSSIPQRQSEGLKDILKQLFPFLK